MTSPFESFGMAFVEAQYFGNYILGTTGMSAFEDLSNTFQFGSQCEVNDDENYAKLLQQLIDDESKLTSTCEEIKAQTKAHFTWESIVTNLNAALND